MSIPLIGEVLLYIFLAFSIILIVCFLVLLFLHLVEKRQVANIKDSNMEPITIERRNSNGKEN